MIQMGLLQSIPMANDTVVVKLQTEEGSTKYGHVTGSVSSSASSLAPDQTRHRWRYVIIWPDVTLVPLDKLTTTISKVDVTGTYLTTMYGR